ncbi:hypothetical protein GQ54DRAFT_84225 [Martensiomyces pterosporus]|nr:hypothetical protein GQ54DRAFT_84225 [Martensiomyces pterosporus]
MLLFSCFLCSCSQALTGQSGTRQEKAHDACPHCCFSRSSCGVLVAEPTVCTCEFYASELCACAKQSPTERQPSVPCLVFSSFLSPCCCCCGAAVSVKLAPPSHSKLPLRSFHCQCIY